LRHEIENEVVIHRVSNHLVVEYYVTIGAEFCNT